MIGQRVGHYRIESNLGGGAWAWRTKGRTRAVALKFLPEEFSKDHQALERFQREAGAASALNHPNICTIYDIGSTKANLTFVMELTLCG